MDTNAILNAAYDADNNALRVSGAGGGAVDSVNGETGVVVLDAADIAFTPAGSIAATDVQAAIEEVAAEAGGGSGDVVGPSSSVANEIVLFDGTTGKLVKSATTTGLLKATSGVLAAAVAGTDYYAPGSTDVAVADGGTGASTAAAARTNLSVGQVIDTDAVQKTISSSSGWATETTATSILNGALVVPAGTLALGDTLRLQAQGTLTNTGTSYTYTWQLGVNTSGSVYTNGGPTSSLAASATSRLWAIDLTLYVDEAAGTSLTNCGFYATGYVAVSVTTTANGGDSLQAAGSYIVWSSVANSGLNVNANDLNVDLRIASSGTNDTQTVVMSRAWLTRTPRQA